MPYHHHCKGDKSLEGGPILLGGGMLAAEVGEAITGASGWVGTGLLGSVLMWLFFRHLPDKDRQLKDFNDASDRRLKEAIDAKDNQIREIVAAYDTRIRDIISAHDAAWDRLNERTEKMIVEQRTDFRAALSTVVDHCKWEAATQRDMMKQEIAEFAEALKDVRFTMEDLRKVLLEQQKQIGHENKHVPPAQ